VAARAQPSGRELLDKARESVATSPCIKRIDTTELSTVISSGTNRFEQPNQTSTVIIEIDFRKHLARQTTTHDGQETVMLKSAERAAMKIGNGPWQIPTGLHEQIAKDMGNLFYCEIEAPETKENAPTWKVAGTEVLDGAETYVVESEGNSAVALAQERMTKGLAKGAVGLSAKLPTVKVLAYSAKHWIRKSDYRHLQAMQTCKLEVSPETSGEPRPLIEQSRTTISKYNYDELKIDIPDEAQRILSDANSSGETAN
jgi:hypothetical protein